MLVSSGENENAPCDILVEKYIFLLLSLIEKVDSGALVKTSEY